MDVEENVNRLNNQIRDDVAVRIQELFSRFLSEYHDPDSAQKKYIKLIDEIIKEPAFTTLAINLKDLEQYNEQLAESIAQEYYRVFPYLQHAAEQILVERGGTEIKKEIYRVLI